LLVNLATGQNTNINYSQILIQNEDEEALPYASVSFSGTSKGTISNEDGYFLLDTTNAVSDTLIISYIGYLKKIIRIKEALSDKQIILKEAEYSLSEIEIISDKEDYAFSLIKRIIKRYRKLNNVAETKAFLNLQTHINQPLEVFEAFYNAKVSPKDGLVKIYLKNGRAGLLEKDNFTFVSLNTTDILCDFSPFKKNPVQKLPFAPTNLGLQLLKIRYDIKLESVIVVDNAKTAVITLVPKLETDKYFTGTYYIDINNNYLQKAVLKSDNSNSVFLKSIQDSVTIDSLNISLELNYTPNSTTLESMIYNYSFSLSSIPNERISSKALVALYDQGSPFSLPVSKPIKLSFDYQRILSYPYSDLFWQNHYYIPSSRKDIDYTTFFKENGYLINHDSICTSSPYIESPYLAWNENIRLRWCDIIEEPKQSVYEMDDGYIQITIQNQYNQLVSCHIFLDYEVVNEKIKYTSRTTIDRSMPYLAELYHDLNTLVYLNIYFDMNEVFRRKLLQELNSKGKISRDEIINNYERKIGNLTDTLYLITNETKKGFNFEKLKKWNKFIEEKLGINNIELFGLKPVSIKEN